MLPRSTLFIAAAIGLVLSAQVVAAENWLGFYQRQNVQTSPSAGLDTDVCVDEILRAQVRYDIPDNLLLAIGFQEAGRKVDGLLTIWPWTANVNGRGAFFNSSDALENWVAETQAQGLRSIDVGCMQVNQKWHAHQFSSLVEAIEPKTNVDYAARFLTALYRETGNWWEAAGRYHSSTPALKEIYLRKLEKNQKIANSGVALQTELIAAASEPIDQPLFNWSADMTGTGAAVVLDTISIYSDVPLQPVLPNYESAD